MPGICTSTMRHEVSPTRGDCKNSLADVNVWAANPSDLNSRAVAVRTEASSSTTEITGTCCTRCNLCSGAGNEGPHDGSSPQAAYDEDDGGRSYT